MRNITSADYEHLSQRPDFTPNLDLTRPTQVVPAHLTDITELIAKMRDQGLPIDGTIDQTLQLRQAVDVAALRSVSRTTLDVLGRDPLECTAEEVCAAMVQAGVERAARSEIKTEHGILMADLALVATREIRATIGPAIDVLKKRWEAAWPAVETAHREGITSHTSAEYIAAEASLKAAAAYRALVKAVPVLDQCAALRLDLARIARYGPPETPAASLYKGPKPKPQDLEAWVSIASGRTDYVQVETPRSGYFIGSIPTPRTGGPWLALVVAGMSAQINTAEEADALLTAA